MRRIAGTASQLIPATILLLGCTAGRGGPDRPSPHSSARWSAPECFVADTTAPTADTLYVIGATPQRDETVPGPFDCIDDRRRSAVGTAPVVVSMEMPPGADLRDVLDLGLVAAGGRRPDVVVTREPDVVGYASRRDGYITSALPWGSTYLLVAAGDLANTVASPASTDTVRDSVVPSLGEREAMARDAVTADARGAAEPFPWRIDARCAVLTTNRASNSRPGSSAPLPIIAYSADDVTARQLAERVHSLAGASERSAWIVAMFGDHAYAEALRILALPADSTTDALATGRAVAAVVSIARDPRARCGTKDDERVPADAVPLIDTRAHVIVRRGSGAAFFVAPDGSLRFVRQRPR